MTATLEFDNVGRRRCRDCNVAIPPPRMFRCGDCLVKHLDRIRKTDPRKTPTKGKDR